MGKFFDILCSMSEANARNHWEIISRMYPSLLGPETEEQISVGTGKSPKPVRSTGELRTLEPNACHSLAGVKAKVDERILL
jgi:hypothetical protein